MRCKKVQKLIVAYLDNELSGRKSDRLTLHLARCPVCSAELESYKKLNGIIERFPKLEERPPLYWQNQLKAIEQKLAAVKSGKKPEPAVRLRWQKPVWGKLAIASATISIVAIILCINIINQPVTTILPKEEINPPMVLARQPTADKPERSVQANRLQPKPAEQPATHGTPTMQEQDITAFGEPKVTHGDISSEEAEKNQTLTKMKSVGGNITSRELAATPTAIAPFSPKEIAGEAKYAKEAYPIGKTKSVSTPEVKGGEFGISQAATTGDTLSQSIGLARGTSVSFTPQRMEQVASYDYRTVIQIVPSALPPVAQPHLAFDSIRARMIQEAMELSIQTHSPDLQIQRFIEIREIPQAESSSPRHLQIKMEFNEK
ncbi:MAG: zf-HC2 domain-containing protein [bacterium]|nr:zf-HC2 domain-containing protein [bacterium]